MGRCTARWAGSLLALVMLATVQLPSAADTVEGVAPLFAGISYTQGGIPIAPHACVPNGVFTLSGGATAAIIVDLPNDEYAGPLSLVGTGMTPCADSALEFGTMPAWLPVTLTGTSLLTGATLHCDDPAQPLTGQYLRVGLHLHIAVQGSCAFNGHASHATVAVEGELVPSLPPQTPTPGSVVTDWAYEGALALDTL